MQIIDKPTRGFLAIVLVIVIALSLSTLTRPRYSTTTRLTAAKTLELAMQGSVTAQSLDRNDQILVVFSDFQCVYCRAIHDTIMELRHNVPSVVVSWRHFPLAHNPRAFTAAVASVCALRQDRFDQYARLIFERQDSLGRVVWTGIAHEASIPDIGQFDRCAGSDDAKGVVLRDIDAALELSIKGTPLLIVQGFRVEGVVSVDSLQRLLSIGW